jgi:GTP-binding protein HflX
VIEHRTDPDKAYLVAFASPDDSLEESQSYLTELTALTESLGMITVGHQVATVRDVSPRYYLGSGKAREITNSAHEAGADLLVFDADLSPGQQRNWEDLTERPVTDRHGVILEIFAARAQTREAHLQVELARLEYLLPRLTSAWSHLSRQRGGRRGTRGEGETQLEVDRRIIQQRIGSMRRELKQVRASRATMRHRRASVPVPSGSIVGYTNAGKSSLLSALSERPVKIADQLFSTLDPATRRVQLGGGQEVLLTDTVGFIRRLPHGLVDAFKSTLEETVVAQLLLHVVDASDSASLERARITNEVLREIGSADKPTIMVLNKIDLADEVCRNRALLEFPDGAPISALTGEGLDDLRESIRSVVANEYSRISVEIPHDRYDLAALIHRTGRVIEESHEESHIRIEAEVPERTRRIVSGL